MVSGCQSELCQLLQGWLDITYLSPDGQFRLSRGNKGTLFVLVRDPSPRERLLQAVERGAGDDEVQAAIEVLKDQGSPISKPAKSPQVFGRWRLRWSKQACPRSHSTMVHCISLAWHLPGCILTRSSQWSRVPKRSCRTQAASVPSHPRTHGDLALHGTANALPCTYGPVWYIWRTNSQSQERFAC